MVTIKWSKESSIRKAGHKTASTDRVNPESALDHVDRSISLRAHLNGRAWYAMYPRRQSVAYVLFISLKCCHVVGTSVQSHHMCPVVALPRNARIIALGIEDFVFNRVVLKHVSTANRRQPCVPLRTYNQRTCLGVSLKKNLMLFVSYRKRKLKFSNTINKWLTKKSHRMRSSTKTTLYEVDVIRFTRLYSHSSRHTQHRIYEQYGLNSISPVFIDHPNTTPTA